MATGTAGRSPPPLPPAKKPGGKWLEYDTFIDTQIRKARGQVKGVELAGALLTLAAGAVLFFLLAALVDHWLIPGGLSVWGRVLGCMIFVGGLGWFLARRLAPLLLLRINPAYAAQTIEKGKPTLKNALVNFLFLREQRGGVSDRVYHAVEEQAATSLSRVSVEATVDRTRVVQIGYVLLVAVAVFGIYCLVSPKNPFETVGRIVMPWADIQQPTRVTIADIRPGSRTAYLGETIEISADLHGIAGDEPVRVLYSTADGQTVDKSVVMVQQPNALRHTAKIPAEEAGLQQDMRYRIEAGDAVSPTFVLQALAAPTITIDRIDYNFPAYTERAPLHVENTGDIRALEGTQVTIHAHSNQSLHAAEIVLAGQAKPQPRRMQIDGTKVVGGFTLALDEHNRGTPQFTRYMLRPDGRDKPQPVQYRIDVFPDLAPEIKFLAPESDEVELPSNGRAALELRALDPDFGLAEVTLSATAGGRTLLDARPLLQKLQRGPFVAKYVVDAGKLKLKEGDIVEYWATARDNRLPTANEVQTSKRRIRIVKADRRPNAQNQRGQANSDNAAERRQPGRQAAGRRSRRAATANETIAASEEFRGQKNQGAKQPDSRDQDKPDANGAAENKADQQGDAGNPQQPNDKRDPRSNDSRNKSPQPKHDPNQKQQRNRGDKNQQPENSNSQDNNASEQSTGGDSQQQQSGGAKQGQQQSGGGQKQSGGKTSSGEKSGGQTSNGQKSGSEKSDGQTSAGQSGNDNAQNGGDKNQSSEQQPGSKHGNQGSQSGGRQDNAASDDQVSGSPPTDDADAIKQILNASKNKPEQGGQDSPTKNPAAGEQKSGEPKAGEPSSAEQKAGTEKTANQKPDQRAGNDQTGEPQPGEQATSKPTGKKPTDQKPSGAGKQSTEQPGGDPKNQTEKSPSDTAGAKQNPSSQQPGDSSAENKAQPGSNPQDKQQDAGSPKPGDNKQPGDNSNRATTNSRAISNSRAATPDSREAKSKSPAISMAPQRSRGTSGQRPTNRSLPIRRRPANPSRSLRARARTALKSRTTRKPNRPPIRRATSRQAANKPGTDNKAAQGEGAQAKTGSQPDQKNPKSDGQPAPPKNPEAKGGDAHSPKGDSVGDKSGAQDKSGSPSPQEGSQPNENKPDSSAGGKPKNAGESDDAKSPTTSPKESNGKTKGQTDGDRSGQGKAGGGESSKNEGTGGPGQKTAADQGAGAAPGAGKGEDSKQPGGDKPSDQRTGNSGTKAGDGSGERATPAANPNGKAAPSKNADAKQPGDAAGAGQSNSRTPASDDINGHGTAFPEVGGGGNATKPAPAGEPGPGTGAAPNLDFAKKQFDLALDRLKKPNPDLLKELHWSQSDAQRLAERLEQMRAAAKDPSPQGDQARRELGDLYRSLGERSGQFTRRGNANANDTQQGLFDAHDGGPPADYADQFDAFQKGTLRGGK